MDLCRMLFEQLCEAEDRALEWSGAAIAALGRPAIDDDAEIEELRAGRVRMEATLRERRAFFRELVEAAEGAE